MRKPDGFERAATAGEAQQAALVVAGGRNPSKRPRGFAATPPGAAVPPPSLSGGCYPTDPTLAMLLNPAAVNVASLRDFCTHVLTPAARHSAHHMAGPRAAAAAQLAPYSLASHRIDERLKDNTKLLQIMPAVSSALAAQHALVRTWRAQLAYGVQEASTVATWARLRGAEGPADACLRMVCDINAAGEHESRRIRAEVKAATGGVMTQTQVIWFTELDESINSTFRWLAHATAALAPMRCASFEAYLDACDAIVQLTSDFISHVEVGFMRRRAWMLDIAPPPPHVDLSPQASAGQLAHLSEVLRRKEQQVAAAAVAAKEAVGPAFNGAAVPPPPPPVAQTEAPPAASLGATPMQMFGLHDDDFTLQDTIFDGGWAM